MGTEEFRFKPKCSKNEITVSDKEGVKKDIENKTVNGSNPIIGSNGAVPVLKRPMKKRPFAELTSAKAVLTNGNGPKPIRSNEVTTATEQSVVESLMLMSHKKKRGGKS